MDLQGSSSDADSSGDSTSADYGNTSASPDTHAQSKTGQF
jgi:hypothetical protein